jgi:hypothetical protein
VSALIDHFRLDVPNAPRHQNNSPSQLEFPVLHSPPSALASRRLCVCFVENVYLMKSGIAVVCSCPSLTLGALRLRGRRRVFDACFSEQSNPQYHFHIAFWRDYGRTGNYGYHQRNWIRPRFHSRVESEQSRHDLCKRHTIEDDADLHGSVHGRDGRYYGDQLSSRWRRVRRRKVHGEQSRASGLIRDPRHRNCRRCRQRPHRNRKWIRSRLLRNLERILPRHDLCEHNPAPGCVTGE